MYLFTCVLVPSLRCTCVGGGPSLSWWAKEVVEDVEDVDEDEDVDVEEDVLV